MELQQTKSITEVFDIQQEDISGKRLARIIFIDGMFSQCKFDGVSNIYTLDDWEFITAVANRVMELAGDYNSSKEGKKWKKPK